MTTIEHKLGEIAFKYIDNLDDWHPAFDKPEDLWRYVKAFLNEANPMLEREWMLRRFKDYKPEVEEKARSLYYCSLHGQEHATDWDELHEDSRDAFRYKAMEALYKGK